MRRRSPLVVPFTPGANNSGSSVPAYISSLSAYGVRKLNGTYNPTNGFATMQSVTPSEWLGSGAPVAGAASLAGVIRGYSGGGKAFSGTNGYVLGGGHGDSAINGIYIPQYAGTSTWTGFRVANLSAIADVRDITDSISTYLDGQRGSHHSYDSCILVPELRRLYAFGGARFSDGNGSAHCKYWDLDTETWVAIPAYPGGGTALVGAWTAYDAASGKILVMGSSVNDVWILDTSDNTWSSAIAITGGGAGFYQCMAYDASRSRGVLFGQGTTVQVFTVNWAAESVTRSTATVTAGNTGGTESMGANGVSALYDPTRDSYWIFGSAGPAGWFSSIYEVNASSFVSTKTTLTGDAITYDTSMQGMYGRFLFRDDWRALFVVTAHDQPPSLIRLPAAA